MPRWFENFLVELPNHSNMFHTPVNSNPHTQSPCTWSSQSLPRIVTTSNTSSFVELYAWYALEHSAEHFLRFTWETCAIAFYPNAFWYLSSKIDLLGTSPLKMLLPKTSCPIDHRTSDQELINRFLDGMVHAFCQTVLLRVVGYCGESRMPCVRSRTLYSVWQSSARRIPVELTNSPYGNDNRNDESSALRTAQALIRAILVSACLGRKNVTIVKIFFSVYFQLSFTKVVDCMNG